ncbi:unnamed protein product [Somion occarium]|uniref:RING-type domain-containing protein n=1 Tax=Somion occarium TaxID=3059160 RepID=A0ABP1DZ87_9APHY
MSVDFATQGLPSLSEASTSSISNLKRRASSSFETMEDSSSRKRLKEDNDVANDSCSSEEDQIVDGQALADDLEQELQCGCCSALVYRPVIVSPCQHFFCGSCLVLWNGGTNCPACRGVSMAVMPSRALQTMVDVLVRSAPWKARPINERIQADEIYRAGLSVRIPTPRAASPEPAIPQSNNNNYVLPCPLCLPGNQWGWRCPQPIADPESDPDNAWLSENGTPPGHAFCGNCENILSIHAPTTSKCDFCQVSFCGIAIPGRCVAAPLPVQHPHAMTDLGDLIQCGELYEAFDYNTVEVDIMLDYLTAQGLTPRHIYKDIIAMILRSPRQFGPLFDADLFSDMHAVAGGVDPDPTAPRNRICRMCAAEVLLWGLKAWWILERKKGFLEQHIMTRPDCPEGSDCPRQKDQTHAKEFNHIIVPMEPPASGPSNDQQDIPVPPEEPFIESNDEPSDDDIDQRVPPHADRASPVVIQAPLPPIAQRIHVSEGELVFPPPNVIHMAGNPYENAGAYASQPMLSSQDQVDALL